MFRAPAAWAAGSFAGEPWSFDQLFEFLGQRWALFVADRRAKADMIEQAFLVVEAEQQRANLLRFFEVAEASYDAIPGSLGFDFLHTFAVATLVGQIGALGDDAVEAHAHVKPFPGERQIVGGGRESQQAAFVLEIFLCEFL